MSKTCGFRVRARAILFSLLHPPEFVRIMPARKSFEPNDFNKKCAAIYFPAYILAQRRVFSSGNATLRNTERQGNSPKFRKTMQNVSCGYFDFLSRMRTRPLIRGRQPSE